MCDGDVGAGGAGDGVEDVHDFVIFALICPSHDERNVEDSQRRNKRRNMRSNSKMFFLVFPSSLYLLSISSLLLPPPPLFLSSVFIRFFFLSYLFNPNSFSHVYSHIRLFPLHLCPWRFQSTFSSLLFSSEWRGVVGRGRENESNCVKEREAPTFSVPATE